MISTVLSNGTLSRWAFGIIIVTHLVSYNECGSVCCLIATVLALLNALFSVLCKNGLKSINIPYLRASHKIDFLLLFLAVWLEVLVLLGICASLARTISCCLDAMSGGLARIYILGRNSPDNEPWPDVLGVGVVFLVAGMFMLGLENTQIFSVLMISGVLFISLILAIVTWLRGNVDAWLKEDLVPKGMPGVLSATALLTISYPNQLPSTGKYPKLKGLGIGFIVLLSNSLIAGCLSTLMQINAEQEYEAVPILTILEKKDLHKVIPAISCLFVVACSGAILELFPETLKIIVSLATSEWKILVKQISYENRESGSPNLAIFTCGSLVAILAFACPLQNLSYMIAGCSLCAGLLRAFYFLYSPFRPKTSHPQQETSLSYSRLNTGQKTNKQSLQKRASSWILNKVPSVSSQNLSLSKSRMKLDNGVGEEMEKEWLLLEGEPGSPRTVDPPMADQESCILSDPSDAECIVKADNSDSDSTDIDAIVDEYRQKVKVSTAGLKELTNLKVPSINSWRTSVACILLILCGVSVGLAGSIYESTISFAVGTSTVLVVSLGMLTIPRYTYTDNTPSTFVCAVSILFNSIVLYATLSYCWLAIVLWIGAGTIIFIRCDTWCCLCLDTSNMSINSSSDQHLINGQQPKITATIRLQPSRNALHQVRMQR